MKTMPLEKSKKRGMETIPPGRAKLLRSVGLGQEPEPQVTITPEELGVRWRLDRTSIKYYQQKGLITPIKLFGKLKSREIRYSMKEILAIEKEAGLPQ